ERPCALCSQVTSGILLRSGSTGSWGQTGSSPHSENLQSLSAKVVFSNDTRKRSVCPRIPHRPMGQRNKKCEACSYDLRGAKRRHIRGPDSREGRFTLVAPGVGASTRNQWTASVLSRTLLLLGVRGRFSPPRCTHRCRATVAMEVSVPASVARSLEPPFSDRRAAYRC